MVGKRETVQAGEDGEKKLMIHPRRRLWSAAAMPIVLMLSGCGSTSSSESTVPWSRDDEIVDIVQVYMNWAAALQRHDYSDAISYCYPGGNAEGRCNTAQDSWDMGNENFPELDSVSVWIPVYLDEGDTETTVRGNHGLNQGPSVPVIYTGFASSVRKVGGVWLIDGFNSNYSVDWW